MGKAKLVFLEIHSQWEKSSKGKLLIKHKDSKAEKDRPFLLPLPRLFLAVCGEQQPRSLVASRKIGPYEADYAEEAKSELTFWRSLTKVLPTLFFSIAGSKFRKCTSSSLKSRKCVKVLKKKRRCPLAEFDTVFMWLKDSPCESKNAPTKCRMAGVTRAMHQK